MLIAKEMSRILGLGLNIPNAEGLPKLDEDGKVRCSSFRCRTVPFGCVQPMHLATVPPPLLLVLLPCCTGRHARPPAHPPPPAAAPQIPKDLKKYAKMIVEADGFAQVYPEHKVRPRGAAGE